MEGSKKRGLTGDIVLAAAVDIVEKKGLANLSIQDLAAALNVKPSSLYNHIRGIDEARAYMTKFSITQLEAVIRNAAVGRARKDALRAIAQAYRHFAKDRPELYRAFISAAGTRDPEIAEAKGFLSRVFQQVLEVYQLEPEWGINFIRSFRSGLHGFVSLEMAGFFQYNSGVSIEESFSAMVEGYLWLLVNNPGGKAD